MVVTCKITKHQFRSFTKSNLTNKSCTHPENQITFSRLSSFPCKYIEVLKPKSDSTNTFFFTESLRKETCIY